MIVEPLSIGADRPEMNQSTTYVEVLIETSTSWGRQLITGISEFARTQTDWQLGIYPAGRSEKLRLKSNWSGQGVIARVNSPELAKDIQEAGVPAVNVSAYTYGLPDIPQVTANEKIMGELAAGHLMNCGLTEFAYYGPSDRPGYEDRAGESFQKAIADRGFTCHVKQRDPNTTEQRVRKGKVESSLSQWLQLLPRPVGLFTWSDIQAFRVIEACRDTDRIVPDDIAVISGETDELMASLASPSISSVDPGPSGVGYEAAYLLSRMIAGKAPEHAVRQVPPKGIIERGSTSVVSVDNPYVARAMAFIRKNVSKKLGVQEISDHVGVSRRMLEEHFRKHLDRSPAAEVRRCRIDHAKHLILTTNKSLAEIGADCGYEFPETFTRAFSRETNETPMQYRTTARLRRINEPPKERL